jgi:hypothetical protein
MDIPEMNQKDEPSTGYQIHLRSWAIGTKVSIHREDDGVKISFSVNEQSNIFKYITGSY